MNKKSASSCRGVSTLAPHSSVHARRVTAGWGSAEMVARRDLFWSSRSQVMVIPLPVPVPRRASSSSSSSFWCSGSSSSSCSLFLSTNIIKLARFFHLQYKQIFGCISYGEAGWFEVGPCPSVCLHDKPWKLHVLVLMDHCFTGGTRAGTGTRGAGSETGWVPRGYLLFYSSSTPFSSTPRPVFPVVLLISNRRSPPYWAVAIRPSVDPLYSANLFF